MGQFRVPINFQGENLMINQGVLEYVANLDTSVEWDKRGYKATRYKKNERNEVQQQLVDAVKDRLGLPKPENIENLPEKLEVFITEALEIYNALKNRQFSHVRDFLNNSEIYFITGPPRTGGTYILKALMELRNEELKHFNHKLIFDYVPLNTQLGEAYGKEHTNQVIFGWAQWIAWVRRRFDLETYNFIPKKHIGMLNQLGLFDQIFGEKAKYIVTTRNPAEAYQSYVERFVPEDENIDPDLEIGLWKYAVLPRTNLGDERWDDFSFQDQFLLYWCACYLEILNFDKPEKIEPLVFGKDYERFLKEFAWEHNLVYSPEEFDPTPREDLPEFSEPCQEMREKVERLWEDKFDKTLYET